MFDNGVPPDEKKKAWFIFLPAFFFGIYAEFFELAA